MSGLEPYLETETVHFIMKTNWARNLVLLLAGEQGIIASVYAYQKDWRMAIYWAAATVLVIAVSY